VLVHNAFFKPKKSKHLNKFLSVQSPRCYRWYRVSLCVFN